MSYALEGIIAYTVKPEKRAAAGRRSGAQSKHEQKVATIHARVPVCA